MDSGPKPAFEIALQAAAASQPLYSLSFVEQGPFLLAVFVASDAGQLTCQDLLNAPMDATVFEVLVPATPGIYAIAPSNSDDYPPSAGGAVAILGYTPPGAFESVQTLAIAGQVIVTSAPANVTAQAAGAHMTGSFHVGFSADPLQTPECVEGGEGFPDGNFIEFPPFCICLDLNGNQVSVCDGGGPQCCISSGPATVFADATFDAVPCYELCSAPDDEFTNCAPLIPDGGLETPDGGCSEECSGPIWANALIGIEGPDGGDDSAAVTEVDVQSYDGGPFEAAQRGPPEGSPRGLLVSFWALSELSETPIVVHLLDGGQLDATVQVGPGQVCGANEGYALFSVNPGQERLVQTTQVSLCE
jgi:hypothetical protein